jgi:hypothetical protein
MQSLSRAWRVEKRTPGSSKTYAHPKSRSRPGCPKLLDFIAFEGEPEVLHSRFSIGSSRFTLGAQHRSNWVGIAPPGEPRASGRRASGEVIWQP